MLRRNRLRWSCLPLLSAAALVVVACGETSPPDASPPSDVDDSGEPADDPDPDDVDPDHADPVPDEDAAEPPTDDLPGEDALEPRVQEAIAALVADGVDRDEIEVVIAERVTWPDGSLGCPQPGMAYTQVLVEGYRIVLSAQGEEIAFHGAGNEPPTRCDAPDPPVSDEPAS